MAVFEHADAGYIMAEHMHAHQALVSCIMQYTQQPSCVVSTRA